MKGKRFTRILALAVAAAITLSLATAALADKEGSVTYNPGQQFLYSLGEDKLFEFTNVMPGDIRAAKVSVNNTNAKDVVVYLRADPGEETHVGFLQQLAFTVTSGGVTLNPSAQKGSDAWPSTGYVDGSLYYVELGTIKTGQAVDINVQMNVPIELGDDYQSAAGHIIWTIAVVEIEPGPTPTISPDRTPRPEIPLGPPVSVDDIPLSPWTGGNESNTQLIVVCVMMVALVLAGTVLLVSKRNKRG